MTTAASAVIFLMSAEYDSEEQLPQAREGDRLSGIFERDDKALVDRIKLYPAERNKNPKPLSAARLGRGDSRQDQSGPHRMGAEPMIA